LELDADGLGVLVAARAEKVCPGHAEAVDAAELAAGLRT
jgi:hypothetical protein